ncbi:uncharacterized protein LOC142586095 [Dermacentor variabilis]|uniref:uncharacterized protein LOC142586095 n=1 Tax=Dermacentor variabilis TaxID=34621 RepID=UPI003F5CA909
MIGWGNRDNWGLYSVTAVNKDGGHKGWLGYKDPNHPGFTAGYYYVYFYFKNSNTLNGWVNNKELNSDDQHPYDVSEVSTSVGYGYSSWHDALTLETHWVVWGSAHNRGSSPSKSLKDQLFPKNDSGNISYRYASALHVHTGAVITITGKYEKNPKQIAPFENATSRQWAGVGIETNTLNFTRRCSAAASPSLTYTVCFRYCASCTKYINKILHTTLATFVIQSLHQSNVCAQMELSSNTLYTVVPKWPGKAPCARGRQKWFFQRRPPRWVGN